MIKCPRCFHDLPDDEFAWTDSADTRVELNPVASRYAAGDAELARDFLINIADPLRYPTTELTEAELQNIRKLKARMEAERLPRGVRRERHLKLGKGGLSDVEWTVQLMQLQHAGDIKDLRVNGTLEALDVLEAKIDRWLMSGEAAQ